MTGVLRREREIWNPERHGGVAYDMWGWRQRSWWRSHKPRKFRSHQKLEEAKDSLLKASEGTWPRSPGPTDTLVSTSSLQNCKRINVLLKASQFAGVVIQPLGSNAQGFSGTSEKGCLLSGYKDILLTQWEWETMYCLGECHEMTSYF